MKKKRNSRDLKVGDFATTDFNGKNEISRVKITMRLEGAKGFQSGVAYRTYPALRHLSEFSWVDSGWFEPEESNHD